MSINKSQMRTIESKPEIAEVGNCKKHGTFDFRYLPFGKKTFVIDCCARCVDEKALEVKLADEKLKADTAIENERKRRENARVNAGISKRNLYKTFDDYICTTEGQTKAKNDCIKYAENFPSDKSMIMVGGVGTGKTLLASAILDRLVDDYDCGIIKTIDLVRKLKATWAKDSEETEEDVLSIYINTELLIIDEVGSQFGSDTEKLFIFDIIDGRYQDMKPTILISNLDIEGIKEAIGERCVDRLREGGGSMIAFDWKSSRI
tara:strand:- start:88 stop:873 length:786 start_codon:yes stop_codon:yes gene_type:complete